MQSLVIAGLRQCYLRPVIWLYVFSLSVGLTLGVPTILQATDAGPRRSTAPVAEPAPARPRFGLFAFFGFALSVFGTTGLVITAFAPGRLATLIAALTLGLAAGAVHPELLAGLSRRAGGDPARH